MFEDNHLESPYEENFYFDIILLTDEEEYCENCDELLEDCICEEEDE
jgi:hypothetical protein